MNLMAAFQACSSVTTREHEQKEREDYQNRYNHLPSHTAPQIQDHQENAQPALLGTHPIKSQQTFPLHTLPSPAPKPRPAQLTSVYQTTASKTVSSDLPSPPNGSTAPQSETLIWEMSHRGAMDDDATRACSRQVAFS